MYEYYTTDSQKSRLRNLGFSQYTLHSSPFFTATSRGLPPVRSQCIVPYRRACAMYFILAALYWESDVCNSLKPSEAYIYIYIYTVNYAFLGSDNDLSQPMLNGCRLDPIDHIIMGFWFIHSFKKMILKLTSGKCQPIIRSLMCYIVNYVYLMTVVGMVSIRSLSNNIWSNAPCIVIV